MAEERRPHDGDEDRSAGLDVWLPAAAAVAAALFLIAAAHAETAPPRAIYDATRFAEAAVEREMAEAAVARAAAEADRAAAVAGHRKAVEVVALPVIEPGRAAPAVPPVRPADLAAAAVEPAPAVRPGWVRTLLPLGIAALLAAALAGIARVWKRTEPSLA